MDYSEEIDKITSLYKEYASVPNPIKGQIFINGKTCFLASKWSVRDVTRSETTRFARTHIVNRNTGKLNCLSFDLPYDVSTECLKAISPSGNFSAILRKVKNENEDEQFIEIWSSNTKLKTFNIKSLDVHGKIYDDEQFGAFRWSSTDKYILYIAEKKVPKFESYFKQQAQDTAESASKVSKGEEYLYREDWGECLVEKIHPIVCVMNIHDGSITAFDCLPEGTSAGQAIWGPNDEHIICVGWEEEPRRLGLIYCTNRKSAIYDINISSKTCRVIGNVGKSSYSPTFSLDKKHLFYLENESLGPHHSGSRIMKYSWDSKELTILLDLVASPTEDEFPGVYLTRFVENCWFNNSLVFNTAWKSKSELVAVDSHSGKVSRITNDNKFGSWTLLGVYQDIIVANVSSPNILPSLAVGIIDTNLHVAWTVTNSSESEPELQVNMVDDIQWSIKTFKPEKDPSPLKNIPYEAILLKSSLSTGAKIPLIVFPHGGPHSAFPASYSFYQALLIKLGFAILAVNFRGSIGFGENSIKSLLGKVGTNDVQDVQQAAELTLKENPELGDPVLFGGSHGGLLVAHLSGQYPDFYKVCACRNPVIDISGNIGTDIPDWAWIEAGINDKYEMTSVYKPDIQKKMWEQSPIRFVDKVKVPTLVAVGLKDLRVPSHQGITYYNALKSRGVPTKLYTYNDNHSLSKVEVEADVFVNMVRWFWKHLKK